MKKLLAVLMVSMSLGVAQVGYTQSLYSGGNFHTHEETDAEINAIPPIVIPILVWIFRGASYWALAKALDAAWDELEEWIDEWYDHPDPDPSGLTAVCKFYDDYSNNPNLTEGQQQMLDDLKDALDYDGEGEDDGGNYCNDLP